MAYDVVFVHLDGNMHVHKTCPSPASARTVARALRMNPEVVRLRLPVLIVDTNDEERYVPFDDEDVE